MRTSRVVKSDDEIAAEMKAQGKTANDIRDALAARQKARADAQAHYDKHPPARTYTPPKV